MITTCTTTSVNNNQMITSNNNNNNDNSNNNPNLPGCQAIDPNSCLYHTERMTIATRQKVPCRQ